MCGPTTTTALGYSQAVLRPSAASAGPSSAVFLPSLCLRVLSQPFVLELALIGAPTPPPLESGDARSRRWSEAEGVSGVGGGGLGEEPRPPKLSRQFHVLPQGRAAGETRARERERDGSKNGLPLPNTMRGIEERE